MTIKDLSPGHLYQCHDGVRRQLVSISGSKVRYRSNGKHMEKTVSIVEFAGWAKQDITVKPKTQLARTPSRVPVPLGRR